MAELSNQIPPPPTEEATEAPSLWRADDSYYYQGLARVTPAVEPWDAAAIHASGERVKLVSETETGVRLAQDFLTGGGDEEAVVRFSVHGLSGNDDKDDDDDDKDDDDDEEEEEEEEAGSGKPRLILPVIIKANNKWSYINELCVSEGSVICVAMATEGRDIYVAVSVDGVLFGDESSCLSRTRNSCCTSMPATTTRIGRVAVVTQYKTGVDAKKCGWQGWQGIYVRCTLHTQGTELRVQRGEGEGGKGGGGGELGGWSQARPVDAALRQVRRAKANEVSHFY